MNAPICRIRGGALALLVMGLLALALPMLTGSPASAQEDGRHPPQDVITKDNVTVTVNAVTYFKVIDHVEVKHVELPDLMRRAMAKRPPCPRSRRSGARP